MITETTDQAKQIELTAEKLSAKELEGLIGGVKGSVTQAGREGRLFGTTSGHGDRENDA